MLVAKYQEMIVAGKATIYLTLLVKFSSKQKLPKKPQARDIAFKMTSLSHNPSVLHRKPFRRENSPVRIWYTNSRIICPVR